MSAATCATTSYANTETSDLWSAIEAASGEPVRDIMDTWILQGGFPLVSVDETPEASGPHEGLWSLAQSPFAYQPPGAGGGGTSEGAGVPDTAIGSKWQVPVIARTIGQVPGQEVRILLGEERSTLRVKSSPDESPSGAGRPLVLLNAGASGYYRVRYPAAHLHRLAGSLDLLEPLERHNLLGDTWAAVVSGHSTLDDFLLLAEALGDEQDPDVWVSVTSVLAFLDLAVDDPTRAPARRVHPCASPTRLRTPRVGRPGGPGRTHCHPALTGARGRWERWAGTPRCAPNARVSRHRTSRAASGSTRTSSLPLRASWPRSEERPSSRRSSIDTGTPTLPRRRSVISTRWPVSLCPICPRRAFELATTEVRSQNAPFLVQLLLQNRENGPATWGRVRDSWDSFVARLPSHTVPRMIEGTKTLCRDTSSPRRSGTSSQSIRSPAAGARCCRSSSDWA